MNENYGKSESTGMVEPSGHIRKTHLTPFHPLLCPLKGPNWLFFGSKVAIMSLPRLQKGESVLCASRHVIHGSLPQSVWRCLLPISALTGHRRVSREDISVAAS